MTARWVAGTVRARALLDRRAGASVTRELAGLPTLDAAVTRLADTAYHRCLPERADPDRAERAVEQALLWNLRVLAGWLPNPGTAMLRVLVADFEIRNIVDKLLALSGEPVPEPYRLGALGTAWRRAAGAASVPDLRRELTASPWGDCGTDDPAALVADLRLSAAGRLAALHASTRPWGAAAAALAVGRQRFLMGDPLAPGTTARARPLLGAAAIGAEDWDAYASRLPRAAAGWVLEGIDDPRRLWRAEERWWTRVEQDAGALARSPGFDVGPSLGCAVLLLADARAVRRALGGVARGGSRREEPGAHA
jgi:hypothetical protein